MKQQSKKEKKKKKKKKKKTNKKKKKKTNTSTLNLEAPRLFSRAKILLLYSKLSGKFCTLKGLISSEDSTSSQGSLQERIFRGKDRVSRILKFPERRHEKGRGGATQEEKVTPCLDR